MSRAGRRRDTAGGDGEQLPHGALSNHDPHKGFRNYVFFLLQKYHIYWDNSDQYKDIVKISKDVGKQNIDRLR